MNYDMHSIHFLDAREQIFPDEFMICYAFELFCFVAVDD